MSTPTLSRRGEWRRWGHWSTSFTPERWSMGSSTAPRRRTRRMRGIQPWRSRMQQILPLDGLTTLPPLAWERLAPGDRAETVAVLARLMAQLVRPASEPEEEPSDE